MSEKQKIEIKKNLHTKNLHNQGYDFELLCKNHPLLSDFMISKHQASTIDYSNPAALIALNTALLKTHYRVDHWQIPNGYLCPPIPGRVDYIHYLAELISKINKDHEINHNKLVALDIGTGASCIYPLLGQRSYQWKFIATDIDPVSISCAKQIVKANAGLDKKIKLLLQPNAQHFFHNIIKEQHKITLTMCNPPFHGSLAEALSGNSRKRENLNKNKKQNARTNIQSNLNFGGQKAELFCEGGELNFIKNMINESQSYKDQVLYFSCLVSKSAHLQAIKRQLKSVTASDVQVIEMSQGHKISRFITWSFLSKQQREVWVDQLLK